MEIKILGTGCPKCKTLTKHTEEAVKQAGVDATVNKVEDINEIMNYGIMVTPALVIDENVVLSGKVASVNEIMNLLTQNQ